MALWQPKRKLTQVFALMLSGVSLVSILLIGALWISYETSHSEEESRKLSAEYTAAHEATISLETNRICDYIEAQRQSSEIKSLRSIRDRAYEAYNLVEAVYTSPEASKLSPATLQALILAGLKGGNLNHGRGYFSVTTLGGRELLTDQDGALNGQPYDHSQSPAFLEITDALLQIKEGFFRYKINRGQPGPVLKDEAQTVYFKLFEPLGWIIGASAYQEDWGRDLQAELLDWATHMSLPADTYLSVINYNGDVLIHPDSEQAGTNYFAHKDDRGLQKVAADIIRGAKNRNKDFIRYSATNPHTGQQAEKIAYFRTIPAWHWVVVTWVYINDLEAALAEHQAILALNVQTQITRIVMISLSMLAVIMLLSKGLSALATRSFTAFFNFFDRSSTSMEEIDPAEQPFEEFARLAVAANTMIKQRKLTTKLLRESELRFKTIFDVSPQVITVSDLDGILWDANEEFKKFSRVDLLEATSLPLEDSFVMTGSQREALWRELKARGTVAGQEIETTGLDGSPLTFLIFGRLIQVQTDSFILVIFTDITALKDSENEKLALQEKLSRSTKMEAMGLMAAEVAHDLNNILSGIIGYPQLLLMEPNITDRQKETLREILAAGQRSAAVVSDLLTIARGVASAKVSLPVNRIISDYTSSPEHKQLLEIFPNVRLDLQLDPGAGNIIASSIHLTKVVMNLVSNAFEAMPATQTGAWVAVKTENLTLPEKRPGFEGHIDPGQYALITVSDNGPGIPLEDVRKIFEPFYSKKIKGRSGTGLGLAIVWNTITDHHGYIDVQTSPAGTAFRLYFPLTQEKTAASAATRRLEEFKGAGQRILVVDDVDIQRKLASKMLTTLGYTPVAVASGEAAVEFLKKEDVDLVILDMIMHPGMNGRETYGAIMEFKPHQKAIIASGMAETDEVAQAQAMGAGQFVNKPYTIEDLALAVQKALAL
ncbi:MAG: cache domain-containing protein [Candidatus Adiutrix sp.]|nr:cache domain-containing protein [Candidatus Adiutrix sp.]